MAELVRPPWIAPASSLILKNVAMAMTPLSLMSRYCDVISASMVSNKQSPLTSPIGYGPAPAVQLSWRRARTDSSADCRSAIRRSRAKSQRRVLRLPPPMVAEAVPASPNGIEVWRIDRAELSPAVTISPENAATPAVPALTENVTVAMCLFTPLR